MLGWVLDHVEHELFSSLEGSSGDWEGFCENIRGKTVWPLYISLQGIEWTNIEYFNNAIICDLIENVSQPASLLRLKPSQH